MTMPFACLLWHCLEKGVTGRAGGMSATFPAHESESVLVFKTDHAEYKRRVGPGVPVCDYVFLCKDHKDSQAKSCLVFVELCGNKSSQSIGQLRSTIETIHKELRESNLIANTK